MSLLAVERAHRRVRRGARASRLDFTVDEGEVVVILGANGAGKTTTLRALSGLIDARGRIAFDGNDIIGWRPSGSRPPGIAHVPQGRGTIADLTVDENLRLGAYTRRDREVAADIERWYDVFPRLARAPEPARGEHERRRAADARDRPSADGPTRSSCCSTSRRSGWRRSSPRSCSARSATLNREQGISMLVVEQNAGLALGIAAAGLRARDRLDRRVGIGRRAGGQR